MPASAEFLGRGNKRRTRVKKKLRKGDERIESLYGYENDVCREREEGGRERERENA